MKLVLAPMEGLTDPLMRAILTQVANYDWCVTEFIRITDSILPDHVYDYYCPELANQGKTIHGTPVHVQFLGNNAEMLVANALKAVRLGAPAIDLNFGCPAKTVNRHRGGAVLLDEPETLYALVKAVRDALPRHIPVSAKMRLGYLDDALSLDNALALEQAGASWICIHARTKADGYTPPAYWEKIYPIQAALHTPIIANGEIWSVADAKACQQQSGCIDLMIGRGAVTRPDLANAIRRGEMDAAMSWDQLVDLQVAFLNGVYKTEVGLLGLYKQWLGMMSKAYPQAQQLWNVVKKIKNLSEIQQQLQAQRSPS